MVQFGSWFLDKEPYWKQALDNCDDFVLEEMGLKREEIENILDHLTELNIIH